MKHQKRNLKSHIIVMFELKFEMHPFLVMHTMQIIMNCIKIFQVWQAVALLEAALKGEDWRQAQIRDALRKIRDSLLKEEDKNLPLGFLHIIKSSNVRAWWSPNCCAWYDIVHSRLINSDYLRSNESTWNACNARVRWMQSSTYIVYIIWEEVLLHLQETIKL